MTERNEAAIEPEGPAVTEVTRNNTIGANKDRRRAAPKRKSRNRKAEPLRVVRAAYKIPEFCDSYRVSRAHLYKMWEDRKGPRTIGEGRWKVITVEDAEAWARRWGRQDETPPAE